MAAVLAMFAPTQLAAATLTVRQQDRAGLPVTAEAGIHTIPGLVATIADTMDV